MKENKVIDYTSGPYLEYSVGYLRQRLADTLKRLEEKRDEFLDMLKKEIPDVDHAIVLMAGVASDTKLSGKFGVQQDLVLRVALISKKMNTLTMLGANYNALPPDTIVRISLEQAKDWDL